MIIRIDIFTDSLYVKVENFPLIDIFADISCRRKFPCKASYHFDIDILQIKEKVRAEGLSYIKFMEKKKSSFYLVHLFTLPSRLCKNYKTQRCKFQGDYGLNTMADLGEASYLKTFKFQYYVRSRLDPPPPIGYFRLF